MSQHDDFDRSLARWFDAEAQPAATADVLARALSATRRRRPRPPLFATLGSHWVGGGRGPISAVATLERMRMRTSMALLLLLLAVALVAGAVLVGASLLQRAPAVGQLVLNVQTRSQSFDPDFVEVAVYADGRVIWGPDERGGYVEQQLTPEGVERLRSRALSTGLFERDLLAIGTDVVGSGYIKIVREDRPVIVAGAGLRPWMCQATPWKTPGSVPHPRRRPWSPSSRRSSVIRRHGGSPTICTYSVRSRHSSRPTFGFRTTGAGPTGRNCHLRPGRS